MVGFHVVHGVEEVKPSRRDDDAVGRLSTAVCSHGRAVR